MATDEVEIVEAFHTGRTADASSLLFEYMAATEAEAGRSVPASIDGLPASLRAECVAPATHFRPPGTVLLALGETEPVGCVGIRALGPVRAEIQRLWVRPLWRGHGRGRALMAAAHAHAERNGIEEVVLDVMPSRQRALDFYRSLGYVDTDPYTDEQHPMVCLRHVLG